MTNYTQNLSIPYAVMSPSNHEAAIFRQRTDRGENRYVIRVKVAWQFCTLFEKAMIGWHEKVGARIVRFLPEPFWDAPKARCTGLRMIRNLGTLSQDEMTGYPAPEEAEYEATFEARLFEYKEDADVVANTLDGELIRYVERRETSAIEAIPVKGHGFKFDPVNASLAVRGNPIPEQGQKIFFSKRLQYIWHAVPGYPEENIKACAGKVNATIFDHGHLKAAAETLLFWGATKEPIADDINPVPLYTVTYEFLMRPDGWNKIYSATTNLFEPVVLASDNTKKMYDTEYFSILFRLEDE